MTNISVGMSGSEFVAAINPQSLTSVTYNADGTVNVITRSDGYTITHAYTGGLLSSVVEAKSGESTVTTTITRNASGQITSTSRVVS